MIFLELGKVLLTFLLIFLNIAAKPTLSDNFTSVPHLQLLHKIISALEISEVFIAVPEQWIIDSLIRSLVEIPNISFNLHSREYRYFKEKETRIYHHSKELVILTTKSAENPFFVKFRNIENSRLIICISLGNSRLSQSSLFVEYHYSNVIFFQNESILKFNVAVKKILKLKTIDDILSTDFIRFPEISWPYLSSVQTLSDFMYPMVVELKDRYSGILGYLIHTFKNYINTRIQKNVKFESLLSRENHTIYINDIHQGSSSGYPFLRTTECFMLPVQDEFLTQEYLRKAFTNYLWFILLILIFYLAAILRVFIHNDTFDCVFEILTISCGSVYKGFNSSNSKKRSIYVLLFVYGFIVFNMYSAKTWSYLSSINRGKTLETLEDIITRNLTLWASLRIDQNILYNYFSTFTYGKGLSFNLTDDDLERDKSNKHLFKYKKDLPKHLAKFNVPNEIFFKNIFAPNISNGYLVNDFIWSHISLQQSLLSKKEFSFSNLCPYTKFIYPLITYYPYPEMSNTMEVFYIRVFEAGLPYIWLQYTQYDVKMKLLRKSSRNFIILGFKFFEIAWYIGFFGTFLSIIAFAIELFKCCRV